MTRAGGQAPADVSGHTVGVAGCGAMGLPMARRLRLAGFDVRGFDVRPIDEFGDFAERMITDAAVFSRCCDTVISVVRDERQTHDLLFDRQALCGPGSRVGTVIVSSTLSPRVIHDVRARLGGAVALIDAPMSGAPAGAESGTLTFMLGGEDEDVSRAMPLFRAMGSAQYPCGALGGGMTVKVLNNYVAVASVAAVRRVLDAARQVGVDTARLREIMSKSSGATWYGDRFDDIAWSREGYDPGNTIGILEKDLAAAADVLSLALPDETTRLEDALRAELRRLEPFDGR